VRPPLDADIIAQEIVEGLQAALTQFAEVASDLERGASESEAEQAFVINRFSAFEMNRLCTSDNGLRPQP
jgi:hypothetical protein